MKERVIKIIFVVCDSNIVLNIFRAIKIIRKILILELNVWKFFTCAYNNFNFNFRQIMAGGSLYI